VERIKSVPWRRIAILIVPVALAIGTFLSIFALYPAQARPQRLHASEADVAIAAMRKKVNANTVSIVSGNITGSYLRYAADIAPALRIGSTRIVSPSTTDAMSAA